MNALNIKPIRYITLAFLILSAALFVILGVLTWMNYDRESKLMRDHYTHEGMTFIAALESAVQIGIDEKEWNLSEIKQLFYRSLDGPNIDYITLVDSTGRVLIDTRGSEAGVVLPQFQNPKTKSTIQTTQYEGEDGNAVLQISMNYPVSSTGTEYRVVVGMNMGEFQEAQSEDVRRALMSAAILLVLTSGTVYFFFLIRKSAKMSETILELEIYLRDILESIPNGLISLDNSGHIGMINRFASNLLGLNDDVMIGRRLEEVLAYDLGQLQHSVADSQELMDDIRRNDGTVVPVGLTFTRVTGSDGTDLGSLYIIRDMRHIAQLERKVEHSERFASLGRMAAGIAHEVRNPLSSIKGFAQYFRDVFENNSPNYEHAVLMVKEADRLNRVIEELLHFSRPLEMNFQLIRINTVIDHAVQLLSSDLQARNIRLSKDTHTTETVNILIDNDKLIQVLLNIIINSMDSIIADGEIAILTIERASDIILEIRDTGCGITKENIQRMFDPFFTTKKSGTGLGLAIVYRIIEQMNGKIEVQSEPGKGTSFVISISKA